MVRASLVLLALVLAAPARSAEIQLVLLHENDLHGHARSFCYPDKDRDERCEIGGAARRATLVKRLRAESRAPVLLLDAGDTSTRGPMATAYEGLDTVELMNAMGVAVATLGNNEFKLRDVADADDAAGAQAGLLRLVRRSQFPWLAANVTSQGALLEGVHPFVVRRVGALRVAFLGLTAPRSGDYAQSRGLVFEDPVAAAERWIPRARAEADIVIALTHVGVDDDRRLARSVTGLDAIVGGDSHTYLWQPVEERAPDGRAVPIVQAGEFGTVLGRFALTFSDAGGTWHLAGYKSRLIPVASAIAPDPAVARLTESYAWRFDETVGRVAGFGSNRAARRAATMALLARIWRDTTGAEIGVQYESDIYDNLRDGKVRRFDVRAVLPFHERLVVGEVLGAQLLKAGAKAKLSLDGTIDPARTYRVAMTTLAVPRLKPSSKAEVAEDTRDVVDGWLRRSGHLSQ